MDEQQQQQVKPIWYFVGLILMIMGGIIFCTGIYLYFHPSMNPTVLAETHPNLWWGSIMILFGFIMYRVSK
ncbi:MAG TPA: hypothetical protein PK595_01590 [Bacteroidota bacterium]|nr:hypothetical protein [Bacteroidota bacterium]